MENPNGNSNEKPTTSAPSVNYNSVNLHSEKQISKPKTSGLMVCQHCKYKWKCKSLSRYPQCPHCRATTTNKVIPTPSQLRIIQRIRNNIVRDMREGVPVGFTEFAVNISAQGLPEELRESLMRHLKQTKVKQFEQKARGELIED